MEKNKYKIEKDLFSTMFKKVDKDETGFSGLIELTDEELQQKVKQCKEHGFEAITCHQEHFGDGMRFVKDGEGLEDIKTMNYSQLKNFLNQCKKEVENINGNIEEIRLGNYPFYIGDRVYDILSQYFISRGIAVRNIMPLESLLYLISCIGNIFETLEVLYRLRKQHIYIYFINSGILSAYCEDTCYDLDYLSTLLNEYYLEDLLTIMQKKNQLTNEQYEKYSWFPYKYDTDMSVMDTKEFENCMTYWGL